jgi:hypothetical protein
MTTTQAVACPKCSGAMWDNRLTKRNPKQPDFKCKDPQCDGVIWPPKNGTAPRTAAPTAPPSNGYDAQGRDFLDRQQETGAPPHVVPNLERLDAIFNTYSACFAFAHRLAHDKMGADATHEGISAMAATCFIAAK